MNLTPILHQYAKMMNNMCLNNNDERYFYHKYNITSDDLININKFPYYCEYKTFNDGTDEIYDSNLCKSCENLLSVLREMLDKPAILFLVNLQQIKINKLKLNCQC